MTITYDGFNGLLIVTSPEINDFVANNVNYSGITITTNITCGSPIIQSYSIDNTSSTDNRYYIVGNTLYIKPALYGITNFVDGIYKIDVKLSKLNGYILISNCKFIDISFKCKVASLLQNIINENSSTDSEKTSTIIHLLHYSLVNGSNCGCNCIEMCGVYAELNTLLSSIDPSCFCTNAALGSTVGATVGNFPSQGVITDSTEVVNTFAEISASTSVRFVYVLTDETNSGDHTLYLYTGTELKLIGIVA